jgi:uncharacterized phage protein (TIGR01671 family)
MREILFRGKNIYNDWIYGYLCQHRGEPVMDNNGMVLEGSDYYIRDWAEKIDTGFYGCNYKVFPSTVGQYTGLTDKNGKKIFEGDIIKIVPDCDYSDDYSISKVYSYNGILCADYHGDDFDSTALGFLEDYLSDGDFEVIGNIHDNPELLEVDK